MYREGSSREGKGLASMVLVSTATPSPVFSALFSGLFSALLSVLLRLAVTAADSVMDTVLLWPTLRM
jgi:hypothetical protein